MEIVELLSFNIDNFILEVSFRTNYDSDDEIREDKIIIDDIKEFGYSFLEDDYFDNDNYDDFEFEDNDLFISDDEILEFLNEYYVVYPDKLPKADLY